MKIIQPKFLIMDSSNCKQKLIRQAHLQMLTTFMIQSMLQLQLILQRIINFLFWIDFSYIDFFSLLYFFQRLSLSQNYSEESDVYSFGVFLLELISGCEAYNRNMSNPYESLVFEVHLTWSSNRVWTALTIWKIVEFCRFKLTIKWHFDEFK